MLRDRAGSERARLSLSVNVGGESVGLEGLFELKSNSGSAIRWPMST